MSDEDSVSLRDFIYLDVERVKSLLAQLDRGLLSDRSDSFGSTSSVEGRAGVSIPALMNVGGAGQYLTTDQSTETRTLHDFVYNQTEEKLLEHNRIRIFPDDFTSARLLDNEVRASLSPVEYVLIKGQVSFSDYGYLTMLLENINEIIRSITEFSFSVQLNEAMGKDKEIIKRSMQNEIASRQLDKAYVKKLQHLLTVFVGNRIDVTAIPFKEYPDIRVVGPLQPTMLRERMDDIRFKFGSQPASEWTVFGQIAAVPQEDAMRSIPKYTFSNDLARAFNVMFASLRGMEDQFRVTYPEIAITPIAIYRQ